MHDTEKLLSFLGIARKAGRLICGTELATQAIRDRRAHAVLLAQDSAPNAKKRIRNSCAYYTVPLYEGTVTMEQLSRALGKAAPVAAVAVTDQGFAQAIDSYFTQTNTQ